MACKNTRQRALGVVKVVELEYLPGQKGFELVRYTGAEPRIELSAITGAKYHLVPGRCLFVDIQDLSRLTSYKEGRRKVVKRVKRSALYADLDEGDQAEEAEDKGIPAGIPESDAESGQDDS